MEMWKDGNVISFEAKVKARNVTVIKSGKTVLGVIPGRGARTRNPTSGFSLRPGMTVKGATPWDYSTARLR